MGNRLISVFIKPHSKQTQIKKLDPETYEISVVSKPVKGKANKEIIELMANFFDISKSRIQIVKGFKSRKKIIKIEEKS
ncbi:MAG: DUF167 domain-containing protein [Candidatus Helarchaeota archaeon]